MWRIGKAIAKLFKGVDLMVALLAFVALLLQSCGVDSFDTASIWKKTPNSVYVPFIDANAGAGGRTVASSNYSLVGSSIGGNSRQAKATSTSFVLVGGVSAASQ